MERIAIYCRMSLDAAGEGLGVERQERECRELAERNGWQVSEVFVDNDISATTGAVRPSFERLLQWKPDRIIVWHTDRIARKTGDLERVIELGCPVNAVTAGHLDLSTPSGRAVARTITAWATYEGEQKSLRQQASHRQRAEAGRPFWANRVPFGFTADGQLNEEEASALRTCYAMVRHGATYAECARWLTEHGIKTATGDRWTSSSLAKLMREPRNAGLISYRGEIQGRGIWEPIIPEVEWRAIVGRKRAGATNTNGRKVRSLLGGIAVCAECGDRLYRGKRKSEKCDRFHYQYQSRCHHVSIEMEWVDAEVRRAISVILARPSWALALGQKVDEGDAAEAARQIIEARDRLEELTKMFAEGDIDTATFKKGRSIAQERIERLEKDAQSFYDQSPLDLYAGGLETLTELWADPRLTIAHQREIVNRTLHSVQVRKRPADVPKGSHELLILTERSPATGQEAGVYQWHGDPLPYKPNWITP